MKLIELDLLVKNYADKHASLCETVTELNRQIDDLKRQHLPAIKRLVAATAGAHDDLKAGIQESPELFQKPRTITMRGIKFGFEKSKGKITFEDSDRVVALIRKHFPDQYETLIRVVETPSKTALAEMSALDLKKLGVTVEATGDVVVIKATDNGVEKLVTALLKDATEDTP